MNIMRIHITRDVVCSADDQGPYPTELLMEVRPETPLREVLGEVIERSFLQYSSSHMCFVARADRDLALLVPADRVILDVENLAGRSAQDLVDGRIHLSHHLTRDQDRMYGEHRRRRLWGKPYP